MNTRMIGNILLNSVKAILQGEFLVRTRCDKFFLHIIYTFFLFWSMIWISMKVENTLVAVEKNKKTLNDMKIYHAQKTVQLVSLNRISVVNSLLQEKGSDVTLPQKPADRIDD